MDYLPVYLLVAAAIFCLFGIAVYAVMRRHSVLDYDSETFIDRYIRNLQRDLERSKMGINIQQYFLIQIGCPVGLAFLAFFISSDRSLMLIFIILGALAPSIILKSMQGTERRKFEDEFVRALTQMASSLHSGMTVEQAIDSVVDCELLTDSIRDDFRTLSSKMKLGTSISDAFFEFADLTKSKDCEDVATAITIMTEIGGDAGVAIEKLQKNIEDRLQYRKKRNSMMTESNMIAVIADVVPLIIIAGTYIFMPDTIHSYFESPTMMIIFFAIIAVLAIGSLVVHRMLSDKIDAT